VYVVVSIVGMFWSTALFAQITDGATCSGVGCATIFEARAGTPGTFITNPLTCRGPLCDWPSTTAGIVVII